MYVSNLVHSDSAARHACSISHTISQEMFITHVLQLSLWWGKKSASVYERNGSGTLRCTKAFDVLSGILCSG